MAAGAGRNGAGRGVVMPLEPIIADEAAALYFGEVMHARLKPMGHRFSYRVMSLLIVLDRLGDADPLSPLFGVNRAALYSFHESDHGARDGSSLRSYVQARAAEHGIDLAGGRVLLIYEVRNTFGEIHPYVLPVRAADLSAAGVRQEQDKLFYVSPFLHMTMR